MPCSQKRPKWGCIRLKRWFRAAFLFLIPVCSQQGRLVQNTNDIVCKPDEFQQETLGLCHWQLGLHCFCSWLNTNVLHHYIDTFWTHNTMWFSGFFFLILSLTVPVYPCWMLQTSHLFKWANLQYWWLINTFFLHNYKYIFLTRLLIFTLSVAFSVKMSPTASSPSGVFTVSTWSERYLLISACRSPPFPKWLWSRRLAFPLTTRTPRAHTRFSRATASPQSKPFPNTAALCLQCCLSAESYIFNDMRRGDAGPTFRQNS